MIKFVFALILVLFSVKHTYAQVAPDLKLVDAIARETADWFTYTRDRMDSERLGQCGDYALYFILKYNATVKSDIARLVVANNSIPSGTYQIGKKTDVAKLGFQGFDNGSSGFLNWSGGLYLYHPVLGAYSLHLEKAWIPKTHFGIDMLDPHQVHVWSSIGDVSVDPTYFDLWPDIFSSPIGFDEP
jgi:hypothetical protein